MVLEDRSPATNDSILRNQVPRQPISQPKLPSNQPIGHSVDHSVDHSIPISPLLLQPRRSRRVAVVMMMMMWWLGHAQNPFSGWCVTSQTVESRLTMRHSHPLLKSPTTTTASQARAGQRLYAVRHGAQRLSAQRLSTLRRPLPVGRLHNPKRHSLDPGPETLFSKG